MITARLLPPVLVVGALFSAAAADSWKAPEPASPDDMRLAGTWAAAQARSADRMAAAPLDKPAFILDDVSLKQHRRFTRYSGDLSGRWIGVAAFLAPLYPKPFAALPAIMAEIPTYQQRDGHFGADQQLPKVARTPGIPILWGNGRLLLGLVEFYERTGDQKALETAKRLGDYFIATDPVYNKAENLRIVGGGACADCFGICYFSCIEGLVALGRVTNDKRYLDQGKRIAELALTVDSEQLCSTSNGIHGTARLIAVRGFADLYAATGETRWRQAAERNWKTFMERYRLPTGGVKEILSAKCDRDEGCAVCDWLRLNLSLWRLTGEGRYLDEAERCLKGHFIFQQFPNGGAGHRLFHQIEGQPVAFKDLGDEAWWCCSEHWARATVDVARFAVTSGEQGPCINLAIDCEGAVAGPGGKWKIAVRETADGFSAALQSPTATEATVRIHRPAWAQEGARIEKPAALSLGDTREAWLIHGVWNGAQEITVHLPALLRSEPAPGNAGVLLRGNDLLVA
ncbi:MAG: glycoside hydrolase family 127 protein, partial [Planctomycetales bacterium]|nr:glycoside hydrolase family 127 protein [Planctomycetales bacterium]